MAFFNFAETMFRVILLFVISFIAGIATNKCEFDVKLKQELVNDGFHRTINYRVEFDNNANRELYVDCIIGLDQILPAGVFANPDELGDLRRFQKLSAMPMSRVNVELPAEESQRMRVFIISDLIDGTASTWLPIHARYQYATANGGHATNKIRPPNLYLRCPDQRLDQCNKDHTTMTFLCNSSSKEKCSWKFIPTTVVTKPVLFNVPVGDTSAYYLVTILTSCMVIGSSLYLLKTLHDYNTAKALAT